MPATSRGGLPRDSQTHRRAARVFRTHGIAIHLRPIERRQIGIGNDVFGEYAIERVVELYTFGRQRASVLSNNLNRLSDRNHLWCSFLCACSFLVPFEFSCAFL